MPQLGSALIATRDLIAACEKRVDVFSSHQPDLIRNFRLHMPLQEPRLGGRGSTVPAGYRPTPNPHAAGSTPAVAPRNASAKHPADQWPL